jgi:hypothetical protein
MVTEAGQEMVADGGEKRGAGEDHNGIERFGAR